MKAYIGRYPKDYNKERKIRIRIDKWDTWNMDTTLAYIILPMLKQLIEQKQGAPFVADEDVPEMLRRNTPWDKDNQDTDELWFERWNFVLNEMIFAFESKLIDWENLFWKRHPKLDLSEHPEDEGKDITPVRWLDEGECDWDGMQAYQTRITNGFRLFGKYYEGLWS
jgi:hypothetical protein